MPINASLYVGAVFGAGCLTLCAAFAQWRTGPDLTFLLTLILGILGIVTQDPASGTYGDSFRRFRLCPVRVRSV